jgi:serine/threonine protein kinase/predicted ATPase
MDPGAQMANGEGRLYRSVHRRATIMNREQRRRAERILEQAFTQPSANQQRFLDQACAGDQLLRDQVEFLLQHEYGAAGFTKSPDALGALRFPDDRTELAGGTWIGCYKIEALLGVGGMGAVYRADDTRLCRKVALKFLPARLVRDEDRVRRFQQEARAASGLNHPNIVTIYEIGEAQEGRFIAMELVQGRTVRAIVGEPLSFDALTQIGRQMAEAVAVAHATGIIHRDIKPENIMVRDDGYVKVLDFGLARLVAASVPQADVETAQRTHPGTVLGTLRYMSPEQARGEEVTSATDIFSLGLVFYELFTGRHPFNADSLIGMLDAMFSAPPLPPTRLNPEIPAPLDALLLQMLQRVPTLRPIATDVARTLAQLADRRPALTTESSLAPTVKSHTVGRAKERTQLRALFASVTAGRGHVVCVTGEPGIGKTTLVEDFLAELAATDRPCSIGRGRCSERLSGTEAYLPWLEALECLLQRSHSASTARLMKMLAPSWYSQIAPLAADAPAGEQAASRDATSQERLKRELSAVLQEVSRLQPLVLFFDDLQWADASTVDLLAFVADRFETIRILIFATYRSSELRLEKHPFLHLQQGLQARGVCHEIPLQFLSRDEIEHYVALEFPDHGLPTDLLALIHAKTEGSPLFVVDLVRYLRDREVITLEQGRWVLAGSLPNIERDLPESVRGMIECKISQLSEDDRRLLVVASTQGYEFDSDVVANVLALDVGEVEDRLELLDRVYALVRLIEEREFPDRTLTLRYRFVHVLYQQHLYGSLRSTRKAHLSAAIAQALERFWGDQRAGVANELAVLYEAARDFGRAADCFRLAAQNTGQVFASQEALALAQRALAMTERLPDSRERRERELSILVVLGNGLIALSGWASSQVEQIYGRARELCEQLGNTQDELPVIYGLYAFSAASGKTRQSLKLGEQFLTLALRQEDPAVVVAHRAVALPSLLLGDPTQARAHFEQIAALYNPDQHRTLTWLYGLEPAVAFTWLAWTLWLLGYPDQARTPAQEALRLSRAVSHAGSQASACIFTAIQHQYRREWQQVRGLAEAGTALAAEHGLAVWVAWGKILLGWTMAQEGQLTDGVNEMRRGLDACQSINHQILRPYFLCLLADTYRTAGRNEEGLSTLDEMQALVEKNEERFWEAELYRVRGELLLTERAALSEAEQCFHRAIDVAQSQKAKSLELRAAVSLARLWRSLNKRVEAHAKLADVYSWFTEGFDTLDLTEARILLDDLS